MKEPGVLIWFRGRSGIPKLSQVYITKSEGFSWYLTRHPPFQISFGRLPKVHLPMPILRSFGVSSATRHGIQGGLGNVFQANVMRGLGRANRSTLGKSALQTKTNSRAGSTRTAKTRTSSGSVLRVYSP